MATAQPDRLIFAGMLITLICVATSARAEAPPSEPSASDNIEEVLVVGARSPRPLSQVAGKVDIITHDQLLDDLAISLSDIVRYTPGVSVVTADSRFGDTELTIRGLSGNRVATLIDGVPVPDQFDIGSFANAGQDFLVADAISRVEILRGPASTLFGNDALGGVVAVVTRDAEEFITSGNTHLGGSITYSGRDDSTIASVSSAFISASGAGSTGGVLHLSSSSGHEPDHSAGDDPDRQDRDRKSLFTKLSHTLASGNRAHLEMSLFDEKIDTDMVSVLGYGRQYANTTSLFGDDKRRRYSLAAGYEFSANSAWLESGNLNTYFQRVDVNQATTEFRDNLDPPISNQREFKYDTDTYGATLDLESTASFRKSEHRISWGVAIERSEIKEQRNGLTTNLDTGISSNMLLGELMPVRDFPNSTADEYSLYVQDEIELGAFTVIPGIRYQAYKLNAKTDTIYAADNPDSNITDSKDSAFAPKLGLLWNVAPDVQLYAQYAHGFRAPPFEDVNIGLDIPLFNIRAIPNPDLKSETSDGLELGLRLQGDEVQFELTAFGVDYDNLIETKVNLGPDPETGTLLFQSRNIDKARVYGLEARISAALDRWIPGLELTSQASWTRGDDRDSDQPLNTVDPAELVTALNWQPRSGLRMSLITTLVDAKHRVDETNTELFKTDGFAIFDMTASYQITAGARINLGVFNAFDKTYWRWASVRNRTDGDPMIDNLSAPGRYATVSVRVDL